MQRVVEITLAPDDMVADGIYSGAGFGPGAAVLVGGLVSGGVATMDIARRIAIASDGDDSAITFTITGTDRYGRAQVETIVGANANEVTTLKDFLTVTEVSASGATDGPVSIGTTVELSSQWIPVDRTDVHNLGVAVKIDGEASYTIEYTLDDIYSPGVGVNPQTDVYFQPYPMADMTSESSDKASAFTTPITAVRLTLDDFTTGAVVTATFAPGPMEGR